MSITTEVIDALHQRIKDLAVDSTPDQLAYLAKSLEAIVDKNAISDVVQMTEVKEIIDVLQRRLKDLAANSTPDQLAYLAKSLEAIVDKSAVSEIVQMADGKLGELLSAARSHLDEINSNKESSISAITEAKTESIGEINTLKTNSLAALKVSSDSHISLLDTRKDANIAAINSVGEGHKDDLRGLVDNFRTMNDVPSGSSIMKEIETREGRIETLETSLKAVNDVPDGSSIMKEVKSRNMIEPGALPFLFGILSRKNNYYGTASFTTELGKWYQDTAKTDYMLQVLTGSHSYSTSYVAFYKPPQLHFLQGQKGTFIYNELYLRYIHSSDQYQYPYALLGVVFVKNTTGSDITRAIRFAATSHWSSGYEGAGLFVGTPNNTDNKKSEISTISWKNICNYSDKNNYFTGSGSVQIPANKTVAIILYTTPYQHNSNYSYYSQYMQWGIYNIRSGFLTTGLEIDVKRTLKAWQCPGLDATYKIWQ